MRSALALLLFIPVFLTSAPVPQTPAEQSEKPLYRPTGKEAALVGSITVPGKTPKPMKIDMAADPICMQVNPNPERQPFVTNEGGLLDAFVYLKGESLQAYKFALPDSDVILQHVNCQYAPHVFGLRVGQKFIVLNNDPTHHNTHPVPKINQEWNQTQAPAGEPIVKTFAREEAMIPIKCNQHPWEKTYVGVMSHPFFAVSDQLGNYEISGLPAGTYKLMVAHEAFSEQELEITLAAGEIRRVDFVFDVENHLKTSWPHWQKGSARKQVAVPVAGSSSRK